jgi:hypothetical protein
VVVVVVVVQMSGKKEGVCVVAVGKQDRNRRGQGRIEKRNRRENEQGLLFAFRPVAFPSLVVEFIAAIKSLRVVSKCVRIGLCDDPVSFLVLLDSCVFRLNLD